MNQDNRTMSLFITLLSLSLGILFSPLTMALDSTVNDDIAESDVELGKGWWIGAALGIGVMDDLEWSSISKQINLLKLDAGYDFNRYWGLYSAYDYSYNYTETAFHNIQVGAQGRYPLTENLSVFGRAGIGYLFNNTQQPQTQTDISQSNFVITSGIGLEYRLSNAVTTRLGYEYTPGIEMANTELGSNSQFVGLNQLYWGLTYKFGQPRAQQVEIREVEVIKKVEIIKKVETTRQLPGATRADYLLPFELAKAVLSEYVRFSLREIADFMQDNPDISADITSRTDDSGSDAFNAKLSTQRAKAVTDYLINLGVDKHRLFVRSVSNSQPLTGVPAIERSVEINFR